MNSSIAAAGEVMIEGKHIGRIEGFHFVPDATEGQTDQRAVLRAALRCAAVRIGRRACRRSLKSPPTARSYSMRNFAYSGAMALVRACCHQVMYWRPKSRPSRQICSTDRHVRKCASVPAI